MPGDAGRPALLERQFLKRFKPDGDGFLYRSLLYGPVRFTPDEVAEFVWLRRRIWSNPFLWGLVLLLGIAAPLWFLQRSGHDAAPYILLCAMVGLVGPAMLLLWAETAPGSAPSDGQAARGKLVDVPQKPARGDYWFLTLWLVLAGWHLWDDAPGVRRILWGILFLVCAGMLGHSLWKLWHRRRGTA